MRTRAQINDALALLADTFPDFELSWEWHDCYILVMASPNFICELVFTVARDRDVDLVLLMMNRIMATRSCN